MNPAAALGGMVAAVTRGFTTHGAYIDNDTFTTGTPSELKTQMLADAAAHGSQSIRWDATKMAPSGAAYMWINVLAPFVCAIVATLFNWALHDGSIFWDDEKAADEPAV